MEANVLGINIKQLFIRSNKQILKDRREKKK